MFNGGVGRSDFPQGDHQALIKSIRTKLLPQGDDMAFIPGHGPMSTLVKSVKRTRSCSEEPPSGKLFPAEITKGRI